MAHWQFFDPAFLLLCNCCCFYPPMAHTYQVHWHCPSSLLIKSPTSFALSTLLWRRLLDVVYQSKWISNRSKREDGEEKKNDMKCVAYRFFDLLSRQVCYSALQRSYICTALNALSFWFSSKKPGYTHKKFQIVQLLFTWCSVQICIRRWNNCGYRCLNSTRFFERRQQISVFFGESRCVYSTQWLFTQYNRLFTLPQLLNW